MNVPSGSRMQGADRPSLGRRRRRPEEPGDEEGASQRKLELDTEERRKLRVYTTENDSAGAQPKKKKNRHSKKPRRKWGGTGKEDFSNRAKHWEQLGFRRMVQHILDNNPSMDVLVPTEELAISRDQLRAKDSDLLKELFLTLRRSEPNQLSLASEAKDPHAWFCDVRLILSSNRGQPYMLNHSTLAYDREVGLQGCYMWILKALIDSHGTTDSADVLRDFLNRARELQDTHRKDKKAQRPRFIQPDFAEMIPCLEPSPAGATLLALPDDPHTPCAVRIGTAAPRYLKRFRLTQHDAHVFADYDSNVYLFHCGQCGKAICEPGKASSMPVYQWFGVAARRLLCMRCLLAWRNSLATGRADREKINKLHMNEFLDRPEPVPREKPIHAERLLDLTARK